MIEHLKELWSYRELIYNLVLRDLKVRYKNSVLGVVWSWLNPLLMMLVFTLVFDILGLGRQAIPNYHIFFLSAFLPWTFFASSIMGGIPSVVSSGHLVKKVYFPREVLPISVVLSNMVNFVISLPVLFVLALFSQHSFSLAVLWLPIPIFIEMMFALGIVLILSTLEVFYRDTHMLMDPVIQAWFFVTPVMYSVHTLPLTATLFKITFVPQLVLFWLNPMASITNTFQDILYHGELTNPRFLLRTSVTAFLILVFGYWFFRRFSHKFGEIV